MAKKITKLEPNDQVGTSVPTYEKVGTAEVGTRIREIQKKVGTVEEAAIIAGINSETLRRWINGESKASFLPLARLCQAAGRSLDWLATGIEPPYNSTSNNLDETALAWALKVVDEVGAGLPMEPNRVASPG